MTDVGSTMLDVRVKFLRQNQTRPEYRLWMQLRGKRICRRRFRRQFPLDRYIVDFVCLSVRLVVEVDARMTSLLTKTPFAPDGSKRRAFA